MYVQDQFFTFEGLTEAPSSLQHLCKMYVSSRLSSCRCGDVECGFSLCYSDVVFLLPFRLASSFHGSV